MLPVNGTFHYHPFELLIWQGLQGVVFFVIPLQILMFDFHFKTSNDSGVPCASDSGV